MQSNTTMDLCIWTVKDVRRSEWASPPPPLTSSSSSSYPTYVQRTEKRRIFRGKNTVYGTVNCDGAQACIDVKMATLEKKKIKYVCQRGAMRVRVVLTDFFLSAKSVRRNTFLHCSHSATSKFIL